MQQKKISLCDWPNLKIAPCSIKINSEVLVMGENNNLLLEVDFRPLT
jgi:hypothetical protein